MRLVIIDLIPALLTWEGRGASAEVDVAYDADATLQDLYDSHRLEGITDSATPGPLLRDALHAHGLIDWFERVASSAEWGPVVTPRVIRKTAAAAGVVADHTATVTAREPLAEALRKARLPVVFTGGPSEFWAVPDALEELGAGWRP